MIGPLMLGGNVFGWTADSATSFAILDRFVGAGFNAVDTADMYSSWAPGHVGGESETVIGEWLRTRRGRERIVLATKVGYQPLESGQAKQRADLSANHIVQAVERSLMRLGTDYIDLYQAHADDVLVPLDETLGAFDELIRSGKVRAIGASHYDAARLTEALETSAELRLPRYESFQPRYNLHDRTEYEAALRNVCIENEVGVLCYSALAKGFLAGGYRVASDFAASQWGGRMESYRTPRSTRVLAALEQTAAELEAGIGETALAWLLAQEAVTAAIFAVNSVTELDQLLDATRLTLDTDQQTRLKVAGELVDGSATHPVAVTI